MAQSFKRPANRPIESPSDAQRIIEALLPTEVKNEVGLEEPTITFLIRHSQRYPRQLLMKLNLVYEGYFRSENPSCPPQSVIVKGACDLECDYAIKTIMAAYKHFGSEFWTAVQLLLSGLESNVLNVTGIISKHGSSGLAIARSMVEVGILGIPESESAEALFAKFQYDDLSVLPLSATSKLALHPMWTRFGVQPGAIKRIISDIENSPANG